MKADYDSKADAISIDLDGPARWDYCERAGERVNIAIAQGQPVNVELLYPTLGIDRPLREAAGSYDLDAEALIAIAQAALAAPDRSVELRVGLRSAPAP